jgi:hypothetical protein
MESHACPPASCGFDYVGRENFACAISYAPPSPAIPSDGSTGDGNTGDGLT